MKEKFKKGVNLLSLIASNRASQSLADMFYEIRKEGILTVNPFFEETVKDDISIAENLFSAYDKSGPEISVFTWNQQNKQFEEQVF